MTAFGHTLTGITNARLVSGIGGSDIVPDVVNHSSLAFGLGGGLDFHMSRMFALRPLQADYIPTRIGKLGAPFPHEQRRCLDIRQ